MAPQYRTHMTDIVPVGFQLAPLPKLRAVGASKGLNMPPITELPRRGAHFDPDVDGYLKVSGPFAPAAERPSVVLGNGDACKLYAKDGTEVYFGHSVDCRELLEQGDW